MNDVRFHKHKGEQMTENVYSQFVFKDGMIHFVFDADRPIKQGEQVRTRRRGESVSCLHRAPSACSHCLALSVVWSSEAAD